MTFTSEKNVESKTQRRVCAAGLALLATGLALSRLSGEESPAPTVAPDSATSRTVGDGVFSEVQVTRGRRDYNSLCARCHGETLGGGEDAPALVGELFFKSWATKNLADYVEYTRVEMPSDGPGKVTRKQSTDITAFILSLNGYPVGPADLPANVEALEKISIPQKK
jgi:mono/diheme cytochrome c family protein